jgi:hypothetical protein
MAKGSLVKTLEMKGLQGAAVHDVMFPGVQLGQSAVTSFSARFSLQKHRLLSALLDVTTVVAAKPGSFRIECCGVTISREFKPIMCVDLEDGERLCKLVYDVTPIVSSKNIGDVEVRVSNFGATLLRLDHVSFASVYEVEGASGDIVYYSGVLLLEPGEGYRLPLAVHRYPVRLHVVTHMPHSEGVIEVNGRRLKGAGYGEYVVDIDRANYVEISYHGRSDVYPRSASVLALLVAGGVVPRPIIDVDAERLGLDRARVKIRNRGSAVAENIIVVSIHKGLVIERKVVPRLEEGGEASIDIGVKGGLTTIRVVWRHLGELHMREARV